MWHVSFRSGVATLQTAIHLLLTYLHNGVTVESFYVCITLNERIVAAQHKEVEVLGALKS